MTSGIDIYLDGAKLLYAIPDKTPTQLQNQYPAKKSLLHLVAFDNATINWLSPDNPYNKGNVSNSKHFLLA